jgi:predicted DCC family thiol-disulfide oxidoreductase YuxK
VIDHPTTMLFDEDCSLCAATAAWLARRVPASRLDLMALADAPSDARLGPIVEGRPLRATLHIVRPDDSIVTGARAVLAAGRLVPRWRLLAIAFDHRLGHALLDPLYRQVALHRRRIGSLLSLPATCPIPTPAERPASL